MTKFVKEQLALIKSKETFSEKDIEYFSNMIQFIEHERLVHLIITIMTGVLFFLFGALYLIASHIVTGLLFGVFVILMVFYIKHYCFLENSVQEMYKEYRKILN